MYRFFQFSGLNGWPKTSSHASSSLRELRDTAGCGLDNTRWVITGPPSGVVIDASSPDAARHFESAKADPK